MRKVWKQLVSIVLAATLVLTSLDITVLASYVNHTESEVMEDASSEILAEVSD